jgi:hypothetical protein
MATGNMFAVLPEEGEEVPQQVAAKPAKASKQAAAAPAPAGLQILNQVYVFLPLTQLFEFTFFYFLPNAH